ADTCFKQTCSSLTTAGAGHRQRNTHTHTQTHPQPPHTHTHRHTHPRARTRHHTRTRARTQPHTPDARTYAHTPTHTSRPCMFGKSHSSGKPTQCFPLKTHDMLHSLTRMAYDIIAQTLCKVL